MLTKWHESEFDLEIAYARAVLLQSSAAARTAVFLIFLQRDSCEILPAKFGLTSMLIDCPSVARGVQRLFFRSDDDDKRQLTVPIGTFAKKERKIYRYW